MSSLEGRVAVVTGASRGIGRAIALRLAEARAQVALLARTASDLEEVCGLILRAGGRAVAITTDVSSSAEVDRAAARVRRILGTVHVVVNNAGVALRQPLAETSDQQWRRIHAVNLDGTFFVTRAFISDLVATRGRVVNISSIAGRQGTGNFTAYCAAKHAVVGLTRALSEELRDAGVSVNAICPGSVDTDMLRGAMPEARPDMTPDDIARTALFLCTEAPAALTGSCLDVFG
jgi:fengycin family lipopeptide synthetase B